MTHFQFDEELTATLDDIKARSDDAPTRSEVLRRAIALLKVAQEGLAHGDRLYLISSDGSKVEITL